MGIAIIISVCFWIKLAGCGIIGCTFRDFESKIANVRRSGEEE